MLSYSDIFKVNNIKWPFRQEGMDNAYQSYRRADIRTFWDSLNEEQRDDVMTLHNAAIVRKVLHLLNEVQLLAEDDVLQEDVQDKGKISICTTSFRCKPNILEETDLWKVASRLIVQMQIQHDGEKASKEEKVKQVRKSNGHCIRFVKGSIDFFADLDKILPSFCDGAKILLGDGLESAFFDRAVSSLYDNSGSELSQLAARWNATLLTVLLCLEDRILRKFTIDTQKKTNSVQISPFLETSAIEEKKGPQSVQEVSTEDEKETGRPTEEDFYAARKLVNRGTSYTLKFTQDNPERAAENRSIDIDEETFLLFDLRRDYILQMLSIMGSYYYPVTEVLSYNYERYMKKLNENPPIDETWELSSSNAAVGTGARERDYNEQFSRPRRRRHFYNRYDGQNDGGYRHQDSHRGPSDQDEAYNRKENSHKSTNVWKGQNQRKHFYRKQKA
eukprot:TRINITY_DN7547_c0_g1_i1.p1 TRINITY_DN7547_c0_g1~~TRINITY_DN7547_c0_g1_i1.p1  ORF type:complete len:446 (+),score=78.02 TRINITY_DN7547_c0_g1_i1:157-1494(+)